MMSQCDEVLTKYRNTKVMVQHCKHHSLSQTVMLLTKNDSFLQLHERLPT
uniref:Uncharacterized protein n=1 Tax=Arion vulgaris TaxID=1028688 RepID=A0A0B6YM49_9EUPU